MGRTGRLGDALLTVFGTAVALGVLVTMRVYVLAVAIPSALIAAIPGVRSGVSFGALPLFVGSLLLIRWLGGASADGWVLVLALWGALVAFDLAADALAQIPSRLADARAAADRPLWRILSIHLRQAEDRPLVPLAARWTAAVVMFLAIAIGTSRWPGAGVLALPYAVIWLRGVNLVALLEHIDVHHRWSEPRTTADGPGIALRTLGFAFEYGVVQLYGLAPGFYYVSHVGNHHIENNSVDDYQCTVGYDRSNFLDFGHISARLALSTWLGAGLLPYFARTRRPRLRRKLLISLAVHAATIAGTLWLVPPVGALFLAGALAVPVFHAIIAFGDHGLFDPADPTNIYRNSLNAHSTTDDHQLFGEYYHAQHHLTPMNWGRLQERAEAAADEYAHQGALRVVDLAYPEDLLRAYWRGDPDGLHPHVGAIGREAVDREAFAHWFWERVRPPGRTTPAGARWIGRLAAALLP